MVGLVNTNPNHKMYGLKNVQILVNAASKLSIFPYFSTCKYLKVNPVTCKKKMVRETITSSYLPRTQALLGIFCGSRGAGGHGKPSHVPLHF